MDAFLTGFDATGRVLLVIVGGSVAVLLLLLAVLLVLGLAAVVFDWITNSLGRRWEKRGRKPRGRLGQIILEAYRIGHSQV